MNTQSKILKLRDEIFNYKISEAMKDFDEIISEIFTLIESVDTQIKDKFMEVIKYLEISLINKDYLLLTDILTYEISPLMLYISEEEIKKNE